MKVLFDYQIYFRQPFGGISRYHTELLQNFKGKEVTPVYSNFVSKNINISSLRPFFRLNSFEEFLEDRFLIKNNTYYNKIIECYNKIRSIEGLYKREFDLFHPTYYDTYFLKFCKKPYVITIHDLTQEKYANLFPVKSVDSDKRTILKNAKRIIAISQNTKNDIINIYNICESKIDVIYHGVNSVFLSTASLRRDLSLPNRYILYIGHRYLYKNFRFFVQSVKEILIQNEDLYLICTGNSFSQEEMDFFTNLGIENKIIHQFVDEESLVNLYRRAVFFVFPSLYEGFGMPILEAFASKCPCLLSNNNCFKEIAGGAAVYFDPTDENSIHDSVNYLLNNEGVRNRLIVEGTERLQKFSWETTAALTYKTYLKALDSKNG